MILEDVDRGRMYCIIALWRIQGNGPSFASRLRLLVLFACLHTHVDRRSAASGNISQKFNDHRRWDNASSYFSDWWFANSMEHSLRTSGLAPVLRRSFQHGRTKSASFSFPRPGLRMDPHTVRLEERTPQHREGSIVQYCTYVLDNPKIKKARPVTTFFLFFSFSFFLTNTQSRLLRYSNRSIVPFSHRGHVRVIITTWSSIHLL